nr:hypothetical protein [Sicyoidochytrium minutum DNA virus]
MDPLGIFGVAAFLGLGFQDVSAERVEDVEWKVDKMSKKVSKIEDEGREWREQRRIDAGVLVKTNRKLRDELRKIEGLPPIPPYKHLHFNNYGRQMARHNVLLVRVLRHLKK